MERGLLFAGIACALGGCAPQAAPAPGNDSANAAAPAPAPPAPRPVAANAPLRDWLVGTWSFGEECATDFLITYEADGRLDNYGDTGGWAIAGDMVTETVRERLENGDEAPRMLTPPETRSYRIERVDAKHGVITFKGRKVPILRC